MKTTRARFKHCLRYCRSIENKARADSLARKFIAKDETSFWKDVKKLNITGTNVVASSIDGVTGEDNITNLWTSHYSNILNCNNGTTEKKYVENHIVTNCKGSPLLLDVKEVMEATLALKSGKCAGVDALHSEHFKYAGDKLSVLLTLLFNSILSHGYLPSDFMKTTIVPILKDKKGLVTDKNNYRPIAVTTVLSKIFELVLLNRLQSKLVTADNQFGFKSGHGTDMCVYVLKHVINYYVSHDSPVFICYLDASKAFDRINHWKLFKKLINRNVNCSIVRLIVYWYSNQSVCIRWGSSYSSCFSVTNGVRQGGILSPVLFNIYMDDLTIDLNGIKIGCTINGQYINHLMYADDTCIISPCPSSLKKLLDVCSDFATKNDIVFNELKTKCMCFKPKWLKNLIVPRISFKGNDLEFVSQHKYLGIVISDDLSDANDIKRHVRGLYGRGNMLVRTFKNCSNDVKHYLFRAYCSSIYGCPLWSSYRSADIRKAAVAYNNVYRHLFSIRRGESISQIYVYNNVNSFYVLVRKYVFSLRECLLASSNSIISTIVSSVYYNVSALSSNWKHVLLHL